MTNQLFVAANESGKSVFVREDPVPSNAIENMPGFDPAVVWGTEPGEPTAWFGKAWGGAGVSALPEIGGTRLLIVTFPPESDFDPDTFDPEAAGAEMVAKLPGLAETFEPDGSGMHRTQTIDYAVVLDGEITLELDGGESRVLKAGDIAVQNQGRHAWKNHSGGSCTLAFVLIGAPAE